MPPRQTAEEQSAPFARISELLDANCLDYGAARHTAHNAAGDGNEGGIVHVDGEGFGLARGVVDVREGDVEGGGLAVAAGKIKYQELLDWILENET